MSNRVKQILCFGDSNTWGYNGVTGKRLPWGDGQVYFSKRWE